MVLKIGLSKLLHNGHFGAKELHEGPLVLENGGLLGLLDSLGCEVKESRRIQLSEEEEEHYGTRHRMALASRHLADVVAKQLNNGLFPIGLLANCNGLMGMLAGFQRSGDDWRPLRVGLIWIDAHGDFNTPETSLSGMLGGMPVAVSTGLCLHRLRRTCGLDPPLPPKYITMVGVRDTDTLEQELIDRNDMIDITVDEIRRLSPVIDLEIERLGKITDLIYVHVDLDVLDPVEIPGAYLAVPNGLTADELSSALEIMFEYPKTAGFGVASYPYNRDPDGVTLNAAYKLIKGVIKGVNNRTD